MIRSIRGEITSRPNVKTPQKLRKTQSLPVFSRLLIGVVKLPGTF
jgi:hypothetical protein